MKLDIIKHERKSVTTEIFILYYHSIIYTDLELSLSIYSSFVHSDSHSQHFSLHKNLSFPLKIFLVNVTKSAVCCGFGHIY